MFTDNPAFPVGALVAQEPALARVFDRLGINYACAGHTPLQDACAAAGLDTPTLMRVLIACEMGRPADDHGHWMLTSTGQLLDHLLLEHHGYLKAELPRVEGLLKKLEHSHGREVGALRELAAGFGAFRAAQEAHMAQEETLVFPLLRQAEARPDAETARAVEGHLSALEGEHQAAWAAMERMARLAQGCRFAETPDLWPMTLDALQELRQDVHCHLHEENNILFPKIRQVLACATALPQERRAVPTGAVVGS